MSLKEHIERDGLVLVKHVFTRREINQLREDIRKYLKDFWIECDCGKVQNNAAVNCDFLEWVFCHPRVVSAMKEIVAEDIAFTGNCDIHQNKLGNWHKDVGFFGSDPFGADDNRIYKIGIYLQDQKQTNRCLRFREGSHRYDNLTEGAERAVTSSVGDIVIFDIRLTHSGALPSICEKLIWRASKFVSTEEKENPIGRILKNMFGKTFRIKAREALFFTFGPNNLATEAFAENIVLAQHGELSSKAFLRPSLAAKLSEQGVAVSHVVNSTNRKRVRRATVECAEESV